MKKLFTILAIILFTTFAYGWQLQWDDQPGEDGYILYYKPYPEPYSYPANPAPGALIQDMTGATTVQLAADTTEWELPTSEFSEGSRYVFALQATLSGSVSGYSDFVCWTWPMPADVVEIPVESGATITINIYQAVP